MYLTAFLLLAFVSSLLLTYCWLKLAIARRWFDIPNQRSSHVIPTPKGGGIAFVGVFTFFSACLFTGGYLVSSEIQLCLAALVLAATGLLDDLIELGIFARLLVQLLVVLLGVYMLPGLPVLVFPGLILSSTLLVAALVILAWVWLINLYNFMDGIDALAACEAIFVSLAIAWISAVMDISHLSILSLLLAVVVCGFLYFNLPMAKVFMGDCGSNFLGFMIGGLGLIALWYEVMTVWTLIILLAVFLVDSTLTLLRRMAAGLVWYHGHKSHAYQRASTLHNSHQKVVLAVCVINVVWLLPLAWLSVINTDIGFWLCLLACVPLITLAYKYQAYDDKHNLLPVSDA